MRKDAFHFRGFRQESRHETSAVGRSPKEGAMIAPRKLPDPSRAPEPAVGKPRYETPLVVELGDVARARGAACKAGSSPTAHCGSGIAAASCGIGSAP